MKKYLIILFVIEISLLYGVLFLSYQAFSKYGGYTDKVLNAQEVLTDINRVEIGVQDMEYSIREYVTTDEDIFLDSYESGKARTNVGLNKLDVDIQDARMKEEQTILRSTLQKYIGNMDAKVKSFKNKESNSTIAKNLEAVKLKLQIKERLDSMRELEGVIIAERRTEVDNVITKIQRIAGWLLFIGTSILFVSFFFFWKNISTQEQAEANLVDKTKELERSNFDLEQFAYSASHDLQEPLRMVSAYCGLIKQRYSVVLGKDGQEFIEFAVDGAKRMKFLIESLLEYSRVGRFGEQAVLPTKRVVDEVIKNLSIAIAESDATINVESILNVEVDQTSLYQLFQNLISNALKFKTKGRAPVITITARRMNNHVKFSISDNGIGIEEQYLTKLFAIFQRLNLREEYEGTGIGLAICKKIVDNYKGRIWIDSTFGEGTTIHFTLPIKDE